MPCISVCHSLRLCPQVFIDGTEIASSPFLLAVQARNCTVNGDPLLVSTDFGECVCAEGAAMAANGRCAADRHFEGWHGIIASCVALVLIVLLVAVAIWWTRRLAQDKVWPVVAPLQAVLWWWSGPVQGVFGIIKTQRGGTPQQPAHPRYANYWAPLTRTRHTPPHPARPRYANDGAP